MKIYLASPFFNETEINNVKAAADVLRMLGHDVYVPMEHENRELSESDPETFSKTTFKLDVDAINDSQAVVALYYDNYSDSGTAWEIGYSYALHKRLIVVHMSNTPSNLMVHEAAHANIKGLLNLGLYDFTNMPYVPWDGKLI